MIISTLMLLGAASTDFGVRSIASTFRPQSPTLLAGAQPTATAMIGSQPTASTLAAAAIIGGRFGRVTSLRRSPEHNKRVGGVVNSYHLSGRAIDIARRPGVSHAQLASQLRSAGFQLVESLDEGDHSHFAFSWGATYRPLQPKGQTRIATQSPQWKVVYAPGGR